MLDFLGGEGVFSDIFSRGRLLYYQFFNVSAFKLSRHVVKNVKQNFKYVLTKFT